MNILRISIVSASLLFTINNSFAAPTFSEYKNHFIAVEGLKYKVYKCSAGFDTVGIGHKLLNSDKRKKEYSAAEVEDFFRKDLESAKQIAKRVFPNFNSQPDEVQIILTSLCFNLGEGGIKKFVKFNKAVTDKKYKVAANELKDSLWFRQVGLRGKKYFNILNSVG